MKQAGMDYNPPKAYAVVDAECATRIADAFEANQIKSSISNDGNFDGSNSNITKSPDREELRDWAELVINGKKVSPATAVLSDTLPHSSLAMAGLRVNAPVTIDAGVVGHIIKKGHDEVDADVIADLPKLLAKPRVTITNTGPVTGCRQWQILADQRDDQGRPFLVALRPITAQAGHTSIQVTGVINAFGRDNSMRYVIEQLLKGNVTWMPQKEVARIQQFLDGEVPLTTDGGSNEGQIRATNSM